MTAAKYKLNHIIAIVDRNGLQQTGRTEDIKPLEPLERKWGAFGWDAQTVDGHNVFELTRAIIRTERTKTKPHVIIAITVKGKGVRFMENVSEFHGKVPEKPLMERALRELETVS